MSRVVFLRRATSVLTVYVPGCNAGKLYTPALLVTTVRDAFVDRLCAVTVTPGMTAPDESLTSPVISPSVCARQGKPRHNQTQSAQVTRTTTDAREAMRIPLLTGVDSPMQTIAGTLIHLGRRGRENSFTMDRGWVRPKRAAARPPRERTHTRRSESRGCKGAPRTRPGRERSELSAVSCSFARRGRAKPATVP